MSKETIEIALAAFMHDIGKFLQKTAKDSGGTISEEYKQKYLPTRDGNYTHQHAAYTAFFIKEKIKKLPEIEDIESFADLAAKHHLEDSKTSSENIKNGGMYIKYADCLSAGIDRQKSEEKINYSKFTQTRLMSIFDDINAPLNVYENRRYQYPLGKFEHNNIFPEKKNDSPADYTTIKEDFASDLEKIKADNLKEWFKKFDELCEKWTTLIPSASAGDVLPDISLYDHARTTSAFAQALYVYHKENDQTTKTSIKDSTAASETKKFLYFKAKFNGIQNFIFSEGAETNKNAAKILRGRSFYVSLLMKRAANLICDRLSLAHTAVVMNAAGTITAILPNTTNTKNTLVELENLINKWLIEQFYGETSISFAYVEASGNDFCSGEEHIAKLGDKLAQELEYKKFRTIPLNKLGVVEEYFKGEQIPCRYCGKRPANPSENSEEVKCPLCQDLIKTGELLTRNQNNSLHLKSPFFGLDKAPYNIITPEDLDNLYVPLNENGSVKDFDALTKNETEKGVEALGVLKADIDNLGKLFLDVSKKGGLSRQATLSRMLDAFWTIWLPNELKENTEYNNIYTVFSGGDDLFLIGKWNEIIDFALHLKDKFQEYTCQKENISKPAISFSAGIAILKAGSPISKFYELSEDALEKSKDYEDGDRKKNALTLFGETIPWEKKSNLRESYEDIEQLIKDKKINSAALSKIMTFIDMAKKEEEIKNNRKEKISSTDLQNLKWRALLTYFIARNDKFKTQHDKQERINSFVKNIENKNARSILKTMLWKNIYENRTRRN